MPTRYSDVGCEASISIVTSIRGWGDERSEDQRPKMKIATPSPAKAKKGFVRDRVNFVVAIIC